MDGLVEVECHSGYTYAQEPRAFTLNERRYHVTTERAWREPDGRHFLVRTEEGDLFELVYAERQDVWLAYAKNDEEVTDNA
jgi:hypothetical protein